jgi:hypothetical protein
MPYKEGKKERVLFTRFFPFTHDWREYGLSFWLMLLTLSQTDRMLWEQVYMHASCINGSV